MHPTAEMYRNTFRVLETEDEHFYASNYHWPMHGLGLSPEVLQKLYHSNAEKILKR